MLPCLRHLTLVSALMCIPVPCDFSWCNKSSRFAWSCKTLCGNGCSWKTWDWGLWQRQLWPTPGENIGVGAWTKAWGSSYCNYHIACIGRAQCSSVSACCAALLLCLGQRGATCPPKSAPGLVSSHELLWGLTACLPWMPFPWRFCMVWRWLPVDGWQLYWISAAATKAEKENNGQRERQKISQRLKGRRKAHSQKAVHFYPWLSVVYITFSLLI